MNTARKLKIPLLPFKELQATTKNSNIQCVIKVSLPFTVCFLLCGKHSAVHNYLENTAPSYRKCMEIRLDLNFTNIRDKENKQILTVKRLLEFSASKSRDVRD